MIRTEEGFIRDVKELIDGRRVGPQLKCGQVGDNEILIVDRRNQSIPLACSMRKIQYTVEPRCKDNCYRHTLLCCCCCTPKQARVLRNSSLDFEPKGLFVKVSKKKGLVCTRYRILWNVNIQQRGNYFGVYFGQDCGIHFLFRPRVNDNFYIERGQNSLIDTLSKEECTLSHPEQETAEPHRGK